MQEFTLRLLQKIEEFHERVKFHKDSPVEGATVEEIDRIMKAQKVTFLPDIYKQFLLILGKKSGGWFAGEDFTIDRLPALKEGFQQALEYLNIWDTSLNDVFVFMDHHGYVHYFFHTSSNERNPIVYYIVSDSAENNITPCCSLSDFLLQNKRC